MLVRGPRDHGTTGRPAGVTNSARDGLAPAGPVTSVLERTAADSGRETLALGFAAKVLEAGQVRRRSHAARGCGGASAVPTGGKPKLADSLVRRRLGLLPGGPRCTAVWPCSRGYAGYLQLPPRILGAGVGLRPNSAPRPVPRHFGSARDRLARGRFVYWASEGWIKSRLADWPWLHSLCSCPALAGRTPPRSRTRSGRSQRRHRGRWSHWRERPRAVATAWRRCISCGERHSLVGGLLAIGRRLRLIRRTRGDMGGGGSVLRGPRSCRPRVMWRTAGRPVASRWSGRSSDSRTSSACGSSATTCWVERRLDALWDHRRVLAVPLLHRGPGNPGLLCFRALSGGTSCRGQLRRPRHHQLRCSRVGKGNHAGPATQAEARPAIPIETTYEAHRAYRGTNRFSVVPVMMLAGAAGVLFAGSRRWDLDMTLRIGSLVFAAHIACSQVSASAGEPPFGCTELVVYRRPRTPRAVRWKASWLVLDRSGQPRQTDQPSDRVWLHRNASLSGETHLWRHRSVVRYQTEPGDARRRRGSVVEAEGG